MEMEATYQPIFAGWTIEETQQCRHRMIAEYELLHAQGVQLQLIEATV